MNRTENSNQKSEKNENNPNVTLRLACHDEAHLIAALHTQSWQSAYRGILTDDYLDNYLPNERLSFWEKRFDTPSVHQHILVAEMSQEPLGFVCALGDDDPQMGMLIDNLHVLPDKKGKGIGKKLLLAAADWARQNYENPHYHLWVYAKNTAACGFYEKMKGKKVMEKVVENPDHTQSLAFCYYWV